MPVMSAIEGAFCRIGPWRTFARRAVLPWALDGHDLTGNVLEIGCGGGDMAEGMSARFPEIHLTATDIDADMVACARRRLARQTNVTVAQADVTALQFGDGSFDAVTSYLMLHHVIAWREALHEVARVLRPGGVLHGYDLTDTRAARLVHRLDRSPHRLVSVPELLGGLVAAGLTAIAIRPSAAGHLVRFRAERAGTAERGTDRLDG